MLRNPINYEQGQSLLKEGDILLFRGSGLFSFIIKRFGQGEYSHAGIASMWRSNGHWRWECSEFREWMGSRTVDLSHYVSANSGAIDVYRAVSTYYKPYYCEKDKIIKSKRYFLDEKCVTNTMRGMTGLAYGYKRIWYIAQHKIPFLRFLYDIKKTVDDTLEEPIYPVCSTAIAYSFSKCGYDLVPNKSDKYTEPSELSRSSLLSYLFTLTE